MVGRERGREGGREEEKREEEKEDGPPFFTRQYACLCIKK